MHRSIVSLALLVGILSVVSSAAAQSQGPSSSEPAYALPMAPGWSTLGILTVADAAKNGYQMGGIPDGLGAMPGKFEDGRYVVDKQFLTLFMNHELPSAEGVPRLHGRTGAYVSHWTIQLNTLQVKSGEDLMRDVYTWDTASRQHLFDPLAQFNRFCSADLPAYTAYFNPKTGKGFKGRMFMDGEESSNGRAMAHVVTGDLKGNSYEVPHLGRMAFENVVAHPDAGDKTVVVGLDDTTPGEVYIYVGSKQTAGNPVQRAGLVGGKLYGIRVTNGGANYGGGAVTRENSGPIVAGSFTLIDVSDFALGDAGDLQTKSTDRGVTKFARPEDGAWDPNNPRVFYFNVTGANVDGNGQSARVYRLIFDSIANPTGGTIELMLDRASIGAPGDPLFAQFDNLAVAGDGTVMVQEDPGNTPYLAKVYTLNPITKVATAVVVSDPARFGTPSTDDEEHSGIIEVTNLVRHARWYENGRQYFLAVLQAHDEELGGEFVEGGQLYLIVSPKR